MGFVWSGASESTTASSFLLKTFLEGVVFEALFNVIALVAQLERQLVHVVILVHVVAEGVILGHSSTWLSILSLGIVITQSVVALRWLHTHVLLQEFFSGELLHEVLAGDKASFFISVLEQDLVESLDDGLHHLLKAEVHSLLLFVVLADCLSKLLVDFLDDSIEPVTHISVRQFHLLVHLSRLFVQFLRRLNLDVELVDLGVG